MSAREAFFLGGGRMKLDANMSGTDANNATTDHGELPHTSSITFSHTTESFAGMRINGEMAEVGHTLPELTVLKELFEGTHEVELIDLGERTGNRRAAHVLVIRGFVQDKDAVLLDLETRVHPFVDKQTIMRGKIMNRQARWCACLGPTAVAADIANGVGVVVPFGNLPHISQLREQLNQTGLPKLHDLNAEVNFYYDAKACYIGFHGDSERPDVCGVVIGRSKALHFQGFRKAIPVGERLSIELHSGDMYIGCETAFGHRWERERANSNVVHYRHAACDLEGNRNIKSNEQIIAEKEKKQDRARAKRQIGAAHAI